MTAGPAVACEHLGAGITGVLLNRPERRNAIDAEVRAGLHAALGTAMDDERTRAVVIAGRGGVFCGGGDLESMDRLEPLAAHERMADGHRIVRLVAKAHKPVVAAVQGWAVGAGAGLALACDTIVVGRSARFAFPFLRLGLIPDWGVALTLPLRTGSARARQILLYARAVAAEEALAIGLADEVVADEAVIAVAVERAGELAAMAPFALARAKQLLADGALDQLLREEAALQGLCLLTDESAEGRAAFREKRRPQFLTTGEQK